MTHSPSLRTSSAVVHRAVTRSLIAAILVAVPSFASAQFAIDKTDLFLDPASMLQRTGVLIVRNEGAVRGQATIKIEDWDRSESGTNRFFSAGTLPQSCAAGLRVFPLTLNLAAGEAQAVRIEFDSTAAPAVRGRECWSVVLVESTVPETVAGGRTLLYRLRTGVKVYAMPRGLTAEGLVSDVAMYTASRDSIASDSSLTKDTVEVAFQNTGTKHVVARGRVEVRRPDNTTVAVVDLPPAYALPGSTMRVRAALPALAVGRYVVLAVLDYGGAEIAAAQLEHEVR
jgi:P pilus assembly chaperone PapD